MKKANFQLPRFTQGFCMFMHPLRCDTRPRVNGKSKFHDLKVRFENLVNDRITPYEKVVKLQFLDRNVHSVE